jgi:hypothetical protein
MARTKSRASVAINIHFELSGFFWGEAKLAPWVAMTGDAGGPATMLSYSFDFDMGGGVLDVLKTPVAPIDAGVDRAKSGPALRGSGRTAGFAGGRGSNRGRSSRTAGRAAAGD